MSSKQPDEFWNETKVRFLAGEVVLYEGTPNVDKLVKARMVAALVVSVFTLFIWLPLLPLHLLVALASAKRHAYYVTNKRVIVTDGLIGYRTRSMPLERISDVQVGCNWIQRSTGIRSIIIRDMTGEAQGGAVMQGLEDATEVQTLILEEVARVNSTLGRATQDDSDGESRGVDAEVVDLLRQIRDALLTKR